MSETTSLKALAYKVLQQNNSRNIHETAAISSETKTQQNENLRETKYVIDLSPYIDHYNERATFYRSKSTNLIKGRSETEWLAMNDTLAQFMKNTNTSMESKKIADFLKKLYEATGFNLRSY